jgi:hypothetical protein
MESKLDDDLGQNIKIFCDNDLAGDQERRISVIGFDIYLLDVPACWHSKSQKVLC